MFQKIIDNYLFIAPSKYKLKKYDVYNYKTGDYITSFGAIHSNGVPYDQYFDKISFYKDYNHLNKERRKRYIIRHMKDKNVSPYPSYFSLKFLW